MSLSPHNVGVIELGLIIVNAHSLPMCERRKQRFTSAVHKENTGKRCASPAILIDEAASHDSTTANGRR